MFKERQRIQLRSAYVQPIKNNADPTKEAKNEKNARVSTPPTPPKPLANGTSRLKRDPKGALAKKFRTLIVIVHCKV